MWDWLSWVGWGWLAVDLLDSYWPKYSKIEILGGLDMQRGKEQSHVLLKLHMRYVFKGLLYLPQHNRGKKEYLHLWIWIITITRPSVRVHWVACGTCTVPDNFFQVGGSLRSHTR